MVNFPIFNRLVISDYAMYPGQGNGLHIDFSDGLTLIVGANGLGKSTLVSILYRMLAGPAEIPGLANRERIGNLEIESAELVKWSDTGTCKKLVCDHAATLSSVG